jgi:lysozyme family protein
LQTQAAKEPSDPWAPDMTDDEIIAHILKSEGGFTNDPDDAGGPTNFGITAADYGSFLKLGRKATADEVRQMPESDAVAIYKSRYISDPNFAAIADDKLKMLLVDSGVLYGTARAAIWLQTALKVKADGKVSPVTLAALPAITDAEAAQAIRKSVLGQRFAATADIVANKPSQLKFLKGWVNRAVSLLEFV